MIVEYIVLWTVIVLNIWIKVTWLHRFISKIV